MFSVAAILYLHGTRACFFPPVFLPFLQLLVFASYEIFVIRITLGYFFLLFYCLLLPPFCIVKHLLLVPPVEIFVVRITLVSYCFLGFCFCHFFCMVKCLFLRNLPLMRFAWLGSRTSYVSICCREDNFKLLPFGEIFLTFLDLFLALSLFYCFSVSIFENVLAMGIFGLFLPCSLVVLCIFFFCMFSRLRFVLLFRLC